MTRIAPLRTVVLLCLLFTFNPASQAQLIGPGIVDSVTSQPVSSRTISFSGTVPGQLDGSLSVVFNIYPDQQSRPALWTETQIVQVAGEKYSVMLGSTSATGLPQDIFAADQAHWLGVQVNGIEKRFLLVSVPYAMKAVEAERLGGLLPSDFVTVQQLQLALQNAASGTTAQPKTGVTAGTGPTPQAAPAGTAPQTATDFTDNNASEVLLVTQQGTGFAIHAITSSQAEAILAQNDSIGGIALHALATNQTTSQTGPSIGVLAEVASSDGIAGEFNNRAGGKILSLRNNGVEVASADSNGNLTVTGQINGNGAGLIGIPQQAINATPFGVPNSVVSRDGAGNFQAGQITALNFSGNGSGLTGIPLEGINATPFGVPNSVVSRDGAGNFQAGQITALNFSGNGSGLTGIPPGGINATPFGVPNSVVSRDGAGNFQAGQITALNFSGNGSGLTGIPPEGINATPFGVPNSVVSRDGAGNFQAGQITALNFSGNGSGLTGVPPQAVNATPLNIANSVVARDATGNFSTGFINASGLNASGAIGIAIHGDSSSVGVEASSPSGIGLWADATANDNTGTALLLSHASLGKLISGGVGTTTALANESFSLDAAGNVSFNGGLMTPYETAGTWIASSLVKLTSDPGSSDAGTVTMTAPGDVAGAIGIITGLPSGSAKIQVAQSGQFFCNFDGPATTGHYVGISKTTAGDCADIGPSYPNDGQQIVGRVLSSLGPSATRILLFQSELHGSAGGPGSGVTSVGAGDASIAIGGTPTSPTIAVANGGITSAKLAPNAVTSASIASGSITTTQLAANAVTSANLAPNSVTSVNITDGSLSPAKITGTAATLGTNTFTGNQIVQGTLASASFGTGSLSAISATFSGGGNSDNQVSIKQTGSGAALVVTANGLSDTTAIKASSIEGDAIDARTTFNYAVNATSTDGIGVLANGGNIGVQSVGTNFGVTAGGATALSGNGTNVGLSVNASAPSGIAVSMTTGSAGKFLSGSSFAGQPVFTEVFNVDNFGNIFSAGGTSAPFPQNAFGTGSNLLVRMDGLGSVQHTSITDTAGIIGVAIGGSANTAQVAYSGVVGCAFSTAAVAGHYVVNSSTSSGFCADGGSSFPSSGQVVGRVVKSGAAGTSIPILLFGSEVRGSSGGANGVSSFNGRSGSVTSASGDYSFAQIAGTAAASQLPANTVFNNQSNTFAADQAIQGNLSSSGNVSATGSVNANAVTAASANFSGTAGATSVLAVNDNGTAGFSFAVNSAHNPAALFTSSGGTVLLAGSMTGPTTILSTAGDLTLNGTATAHGFSGDGSDLTNVNAASVGGVAVANLATTSALGAETTARQSGDTTLQNNINAESTTRASADTTLQNNLNAESSARQTADATLQGGINAVSAADAKLATANTFSAKQTLAASTASAASLNVPGGAAPSAPAAGDVWNTGSTLQYRDSASTTRSLVSTTQSGGLQLLKLTASVTPSNVNSQVCTEQTFTVTGINTGDVLLSVLQPSTSNPGANIAIGGFRITAANTVAVQFCNVGKNNSTPTSGTYTFALMR